jgi:hypothetical protein
MQIRRPEKRSRSHREFFPTPVISHSTGGGIMRDSLLQPKLSYLTHESPWRDIFVVIGITALSILISDHFNLTESL